MKEIIKVILSLIEKIGPTLATLTAVYLAYLYTKKQKLSEDKRDEFKKLRTITSHLIQIWRELSLIEYYSSSDDFFADLVFIDQQFALNYFNIDINRINRFEQLFIESIEEIKSVNVALFYSLENNFMNYKKSLNIINDSRAKIEPLDTDFKGTLNEILKNTVRDLESIILKTSENLPKVEKEQISNIIKDHHESLKQTDFEYDVPNFLINLFNKYLPTKENITNEEIKYFFNDSTIKLIFSKFSPIIGELFIKNNPLETLQVVFETIRNPQNIEGQINETELLLQLKFNDLESQMFQNNIGFYKMICALFKKFDPNIPFGIKRLLLQINKGEVNLKNEIEKEKIRILASSSNE